MTYTNQRSYWFLFGLALIAVVAVLSVASTAQAFSTGGGGEGCCGDGGGYGDGPGYGDGGYPWTPPVSYPSPSCTISANPNNVEYNGSTTVSWNSQNAASASLSSVGSVAVSGSRLFSNITSTRTYVLTVTGLYGGTATCQTTVTAQPQQQLPSCTISANPTNVPYNGSTTITWNSTNATSASLSEVGTVGLSGSHAFAGITGTRTYTLTVTSQAGTNTCQVTVTAQPQTHVPSCTLYANPTNVAYGGVSTLTWNSTYADNAVIDNGIGSVALSGSRSTDAIYGTRTYHMTVYGQGGSATCQATVYAEQQHQTPTCSIYANPSTVSYGGSSTITWSSSNATSATIDSFGSVSTSGSRTTGAIYGTRTYHMTVYGYNGQTNTCQTTVTTGQIHYQQPSCTISINPSYLTPGQRATLSWSSSNATSATIDDLGSVSTYGSRDVYPNYSRTYRMTVYGTGGQQATCYASANVSGGYTQVSTGYISLTQVPYTGFDFGTFGNTLYWLALAAVAGGAAYFLVFFRGGILNLMGVFTKRADEEGGIEDVVITEAPAASAHEEFPVTTSTTSENRPKGLVLDESGSMPRLIVNNQ